MTLNINQIMNSLMMPHVSPRWMSHGVSVVMILVNIDNVMATPQFIFQQYMAHHRPMVLYCEIFVCLVLS